MAGTSRFGKARKPASKLSRGEHRKQVRRRIRKKIFGTGPRPRLAVFRSAKHIYAQVVNDTDGRTVASASTGDKEIKTKVSYGGNVAAAKVVGQVLGERARKAGVEKVVFDRGGFAYHGRIKALAEAAREAGIKF